MLAPESPQKLPERRSFGHFALTALLFFTFLGSDCEPSGSEAAGAVMMASPLVFLGGLAMLAILRSLWQPLIGPRPLLKKLHAQTLLGLLVAALIGNFVAVEASEWAKIAIWAFGTSYLSVLLVVWRVWLYKASESAFVLAPVATIAGLLVPVPFLILAPLREEHKELKDAIVMIPWFVPGMLGYVTFPLFVAAVFEAVGRRIFAEESPQRPSKAPGE